MDKLDESNLLGPLKGFKGDESYHENTQTYRLEYRHSDGRYDWENGLDARIIEAHSDAEAVMNAKEYILGFRDKGPFQPLPKIEKLVRIERKEIIIELGKGK